MRSNSIEIKEQKRNSVNSPVLEHIGLKDSDQMNLVDSNRNNGGKNETTNAGGTVKVVNVKSIIKDATDTDAERNNVKKIDVNSKRNSSQSKGISSKEQSSDSLVKEPITVDYLKNKYQSKILTVLNQSFCFELLNILINSFFVSDYFN